MPGSPPGRTTRSSRTEIQGFSYPRLDETVRQGFLVSSGVTVPFAALVLQRPYQAAILIPFRLAQTPGPKLRSPRCSCRGSPPPSVAASCRVGAAPPRRGLLGRRAPSWHRTLRESPCPAPSASHI